ncbi:hypothetical protein [Aliarcobacter butzleri]|uniref:Uncharacterized protein n=2 Tax=Aliarcobacter butzleri TaxID=28197 RepID=A0AAP4PK68_9BACT|nr:hypothetical protein [Aliarcobacter butzleri]KLE10460.1 hypothetical protein AF80_03955 [Aliarcobacter butzleri L355]MCT7556173.1 hypothetical protein [Aliarcobacter butzleri]MCT7574008.1 hypothetical protein [Aliarcobacter butzleri]MCT7587459.1 hypothetical protein [Aliarcobacter butzleri]MDN5064186.1 hypothetical protein [Aliarcobacter butzleri]
MQISNTQTQTYSYNQSLNTTNKPNNTDNTSNSFDTQVTEKENIKKSSSKIIEYLEKNDKFSSLSKEDEELFRDILADSVFSGQEMKRLNYEQFKKLSDLVNPANISKEQNIEELPGVLLQGTYLSSITDNEDFNKALFETAKNIDNNKERIDFLDTVSNNLGYNNKQVLFGKGSIEENIQADIAREKEKYKDPSNSEMLANIIQDLKNWKITDYGSFIKNLTTEYKELSEHPLLSSEAKLKYKKYSEYTANMEINHNKAKNEPKYA